MGINEVKFDIGAQNVFYGIIGSIILGGIAFFFSDGITLFIKEHLGLTVSSWIIGPCLLILVTSCAFIIYCKVFGKIKLLKSMYNIFILVLKVLLFIIGLIVIRKVFFPTESLLGGYVFILLSSCIVLPSILSSCLLAMESGCPMTIEIASLRKCSRFAITGTCIPFHNNDNGTLTTYLISNNAYANKEWMFPGGHAFTENDTPTPEIVAVNKALEEAGLNVKLCENAYGNVKDGEIFSRTNHPHATYIFKLNSRVKCYEKKGHKYHYDCVYIAEIESIDTGSPSSEREAFSFPISVKEKKDMSGLIGTWMNSHKNVTYDTNSIEYISTMLFDALVEYKKIKNIS